MSDRIARMIDLSRDIAHGMITDPRLPPPRVHDVWTREASATRYAPGVSFQIAAIDIVQNTGTYMDSPWHRHETLPDIAGLPLERTADLPGVCIDARAPVARGERRLDAPLFERENIRGKAVLICTGFDRLWDDPRYRDGSHPFLTEAAATFLANQGSLLYGVDAINADDFADLRRPAHTILLGAPADAHAGRTGPGVPIIENLVGLEALLEERPSGLGGACASRAFRFTAAAPKVKGLGSFPVRAWATLA